jgi:hypothetical protein
MHGMAAGGMNNATHTEHDDVVRKCEMMKDLSVRKGSADDARSVHYAVPTVTLATHNTVS